ncbi:DUF3137 domain-containing protein [Kibdelosporangium philippinense]|uniref:DUF3137 domain-containing protein n=1 Tax=Kibdelosporangium philippinense TaxID=211113 RepID=A0ABS8Z0V6_9PSEU|nr:DUF3137 domain-containing protein [Kibdelosporangium philippinense]MCE7001589.1 DUF3137 domain-containing protein [Kibdelosporangium philippinense]
MSPSPILIIAVVVGGLIVVGGLLAWLFIWIKKTNDREEAGTFGRLNEEAPRRGWNYVERADDYVDVFNDVERYPKLSEPIVGHAASPTALQAHEVLTGEHRGRQFLAAKFWTSKPADSREVGGEKWFHAIWVHTPAPRPTLDVRSVPRMQSAVGSALGMGDLKIGHPEFDARYQVTAQNEQFARDVLSPQLIDLMLNDSRSFQGFWIRGQQLEVIGDVVGDHRDPAQLVPALDLRNDIMDRIPQQVWT